MAESIPLGQPLQARFGEQAYGRADSIPWTIWCMFAGIACGLVGGQWDISWHLSIGRDTFWTPAHILIQLTGVLAGIACGYMILTATFGGNNRDTKQVGEDLGIPRATGSVYRDVGLHRDADLRAVR